jgi:hypothetical protein
MDDPSTQLRLSDHAGSVHRVNGPAQNPAQQSVSEFGTKYQAPNMDLEALNGANNDNLQKSLASRMLRGYQYNKLRTADSVKENSVHTMKPIHRQQTFKSGHGLVQSNTMKFGETTQGEAEWNKRWPILQF